MTGAGGSIDVYSELGLGTTISVLLPVTDEDAVPAAPPAVAGGDQRGHGETILLVEAEASLRELTSRILTRTGYQVCAAARTCSISSSMGESAASAWASGWTCSAVKSA